MRCGYAAGYVGKQRGHTDQVSAIVEFDRQCLLRELLRIHADQKRYRGVYKPVGFEKSNFGPAQKCESQFGGPNFGHTLGPKIRAPKLAQAWAPLEPIHS